MSFGFLNHSAAIERAGGGSLRAELVPVPAVSHPWHPHPTVKQLLLLTHFTDEKGEVQRGKGPACGCGRQVV